MSNRRIRRVDLSLHLSPEQTRADLRAMLELKKWHQALSQAGSNPGDVSMEMRRFHRNVYLAGLQLQLMSPPLCSHIAESLGRDALTLDELCRELASAGLLPFATAPSTPPVPEQSATGGDFSKQQLRQMRALMSDALQRQATPDDASRQALNELQSEVAQLKVLLDRQNLLLQQLRTSGRAVEPESSKKGQAEALDVSALNAPTEKMKEIRKKGIF